jgi:xylulokinase
MAFDVVNKCWDIELLQLSGMDTDKLPQPIPTGEKVGIVLPEVARFLGLPQGVIVAAGGHDQVCAAIGAGVLSTDVAIDGTGTVECITSVFDKPQLEESFLNNNFVCVPYPVKGMYTTYAFNFTGGAILKWYKDTLGLYEQQVAKEQGISVYRYLDMQGAKEPTGIIVIPHFSGSATPDMNEHAKGAFLGITMDTDAPMLYRALIEGVTYEMMYNLEKLEEFGISMSVLRAVGGGSKSPYWLQMKADILGKTIIPLDLDEAGIAGTAMLSGVCCGVYQSLEEAEKLFVKKKQPYEPNMELHQAYLKHYQRFKMVRQMIADVFR